jgi:acetyltransferase
MAKSEARCGFNYTTRHYSLDLADTVGLANGRDVTVRPILPLNADKFQAFVRNLSDTSRSNRFLHGLRELPVHLLQRLTQVDYRTHMALVGEVVNDGMSIIIAEARYAVDPEESSAELAVAVADDWQGLGLAVALFRRLAQHAAAAGLRRLQRHYGSAGQQLLAQRGEVTVAA